MDEEMMMESSQTNAPIDEEMTAESPENETPTSTEEVETTETEPLEENPAEEEAAQTTTSPAPESDGAVTFTVTNFVGSAAQAQITLQETAEGIQVSVEATDPVIDLRGLFFNLEDDSLLDGLVVTGTDITDSQFGPAGSVNQVTGNPSISPRAFDAGVEIGTSGSAQDNISVTEFVISHSSMELTLDLFLGQNFGVRTQNGKLEGIAAEAMDAGEDSMSAVEDEMSDVAAGDTAETGDEVMSETADDMMSDMSDMSEMEHIIGTASGQFSGPVESDSEAVVNLASINGGIENQFEWGVAAEGSFTNIVQFDGSDFGATVGESFKIGQLFYRNGTTLQNFNGDFGFSLNLDIDGTDNDPGSFDFFFNILNTQNTTGDAVLDGDRLQFATGGLSPQTFALNGKTFTVELSGFSTDGGTTIQGGFDSPEESFAIANLYGRIVAIPDEAAELFEPLSEEAVDEIAAGDGVFVGGDETGEGAVAGSVVIQSEASLNIQWSISTSAALAAEEDDAFEVPEGTPVDLDTLGVNEVSGSDTDDSINGSEDNDIVMSEDGNDTIDGESGNDVLIGQSGDDEVEGGEGVDYVNGNEGNDVVMGEDGDDIVRGGKGDDVVQGGEGDDAVAGDLGFDMLIGGGGSDTFILRAELDVELQTSLSADIIADFEMGIDRIAITSSTVVTFEVGDFDLDGTNDVGIKLENNAFIGYVLGTEDVTQVEESIVEVPDADFVA